MNNEVSVDEEAADRDHRLRVIGFLMIVGGTLLAGVGAVIDWVSVRIAGIDLGDVIPVSKGVDLWQGKLILAMAGAALICVLASRLAERLAVRRAAAAVVIVAGLVVVGIAGAYGVSGASSAERDELEIAREEFPNLPDGALEGHLEIGVWVSLAGGVLTAVGGVLALAWVTRTAEPPEAPPPH
jgi:drug/metabolite transporter (DMT)-like permease